MAWDKALRGLREAVFRYWFLLTAHADEAAREDGFTVEDIREALLNGELIENYPQHPRGACCLVYGKVVGGRDMHIVITTDKIPPRVITVYEPVPPYWVTPRQRGRRL